METLIKTITWGIDNEALRFKVGKCLEKATYELKVYAEHKAKFAKAVKDGDMEMAQVVNDFTCLFGFGGLPFFSKETLYYLVSYGTLFIMGIVGCTPLVKTTCEKLCAKKGIGVAMAAAQGIVLIALLVLCTAFLVDGSFSPFLYFRF